MSHEPLSPELALVDPELGARARAELPSRPVLDLPPRRVAPGTAPTSPAQPAEERTRHYPVWARLTAALWLVVLGILIGGTAIPHAQDRPRVIPQHEDPTICTPEPEQTEQLEPQLPRPPRSGP